MANDESVHTVVNALTVDVEDYFQVSAFEDRVPRSDWTEHESRVGANTRVILDSLAAAGVRGTFFVLGWVAEKFPELVRAIHDAGHEIGSHGFWHRRVYTQTPREFRNDLRRSRETLEVVTGERVAAYRAPSFSITRRSLWALDILLEEGFTLDSSIFPTYHDRYGIPGAPLTPFRLERPAGTLREVPPTVHRVFGYPLPVGGGGYFRLYPYWFTRSALRAINAGGRSAVVYLHPWEVDPEQPRLPASRVTTFRHYVNLSRTRERLDRLLHDFAFGTLSAVFAQESGSAGWPTWGPPADVNAAA
jgi:polysaccharide deacetylase family protein (PEP-CTERM system associated)